MADTTQKILSVQLDATDAINGIVKLNDAIDANNQKMALNKKAIDENNKAMKESGADTMALAQKNEELTKTNVELSAQTKELTNERRILQKEVQNEIRANAAAEGSLKSLRAQLSNLTKQFDSLSKSERQNEQVGGALMKQINEVTTEIKQAEKETQRYFRNVGNYPEAMGSVKGAMRTMQQEIMNLTLQYREMDDEMKRSDAGVELKNKIDQLTQQASKYKDVMSDVSQSIQRGASDTAALNALTEGAKVLTASFGLAKNAAVALGISNEGLQKSMLKIQQAMQAVQALTVIQNALQKQSNLMKGIEILQTKAAATAKALETKTTIGATAAQKAFNLVANANPYVLLATAILTVVGAVVAFTAATDDATEATEKETGTIKINSGAIDANAIAKERIAKAEKDWSDSVSQNASNQISQYTKLQLKWLEVNKDQKKREQFQREYGEEVNRVAGRVLKLSEYENFFVRDTDKVVAAILARAKAEAGAQKYAEAVLKKAENDRKGTVANGRYKYTATTDSEIDLDDRRYGDVRAAIEAGILTSNDVKGVNTMLSFYYKLSETGVKKMNKLWAENAAAIRAADDAEIDYLKDFTIGATKETILAENAAGMGHGYNPPKGFGGGGGGHTGRGGGGNTTTPKDTAQSLEQLTSRLQSIQADALNRMAATSEQYTQKWIDDSKKAIEQQAKNEISATEEARKKDIDNLKKSLEAKKITQGQYNRLILETQEAYDNKVVAIEQQKLADLKKIDDEIAQRQKDAAEKARKAAEEALKKQREDALALQAAIVEGLPEGSVMRLNAQLDNLQMLMDAELAMYENNERMIQAVKAKYGLEAQKLQQDYARKEIEIQQQKYEAIANIVGGLGQVLTEFGDDQKAFVILQKTLALAEVAINQGVAISAAIKNAATGSITVWNMIAQIATGITSVTVAMVQAFKSIDSAKFATGGYVRGAGTSTSDSIPIRVSNGESVMNANTTAMFSGLLSSLNQLGGGVPIQVQQSASSIRGEDMLARAVARGVAMLPAPVVSVEDINRGQRQVQVMTERATL